MSRILPIALVVLATGVASLHVSASFTRSRHVVVREPTTPDEAGTVTVRVPASAVPLTVIIVRASGNAERVALRFSQNGELLSEIAVPPDDARVEVQPNVDLRSGATLRLSAADPDWSLEYLELANVHGFVSGIINANVVPAGRRDHPDLPWWLVVCLVSPFAGLVLTSRAQSPLGRRFEQVARGFVIALFGAVILLPLISRYAVGLSLPTFLGFLVLASSGAIVRRYTAVRAFAGRRNPAWGRLLEGVVIAGLIIGFFIAAIVHGLSERGGDYTRFLYMSEEFSDAPVLDTYHEARESIATYTSGYDGQFMYLMAFDPFLTRLEPSRYSEVVDSPPYRYGRIGFSLLARAFAGGSPTALPRTMVWLILAGHGLAAVFLVMIAERLEASPWQILGYVLIPGLMVSLGRALPEPIAGALLLGGLWAYLTHRRPLAVVLWGLSLMVRETGVILVLSVSAFEFARRANRRRALSLLLALIPAVCWRLYVGWRLAPAFGLRAFWSDPGDLTFPLAGFVRLWLVDGVSEPSNLVFPILLVALLALAVATFRARPGPLPAAASAYALLGVSLSYEKIWEWAGNGERGTYEAFLLLLVASLPASGLPGRLRRALVAFAVALFVYSFQYATHATWFRSGLMLFD